MFPCLLHPLVTSQDRLLSIGNRGAHIGLWYRSAWGVDCHNYLASQVPYFPGWLLLLGDLPHSAVSNTRICVISGICIIGITHVQCVPVRPQETGWDIFPALLYVRHTYMISSMNMEMVPTDTHHYWKQLLNSLQIHMSTAVKHLTVVAGSQARGAGPHHGGSDSASIRIKC